MKRIKDLIVKAAFENSLRGDRHQSVCRLLWLPVSKERRCYHFEVELLFFVVNSTVIDHEIIHGYLYFSFENGITRLFFFFFVARQILEKSE